MGGLGKIEDFGYFRADATHPLGSRSQNSKYEGVAPISFGEMGSAFGLPDGTTGQYNNTYQITDNFSKIVGKHSLKFGGDIRYIQVNKRNTYTSNGWFEFTEVKPGTTSPTTCSALPTCLTRRARSCWIPAPSILGCMRRTPTASVLI